MANQHYQFSCSATNIISRFQSCSHRLALLPISIFRDTPDRSDVQLASLFLIKLGGSYALLNDLSFDANLAAGLPILLLAQRAEDLQPFFNRCKLLLKRYYIGVTDLRELLFGDDWLVLISTVEALWPDRAL
jgi:hypothetical protein